MNCDDYEFIMEYTCCVLHQVKVATNMDGVFTFTLKSYTSHHNYTPTKKIVTARRRKMSAFYEQYESTSYPLFWTRHKRD